MPVVIGEAVGVGGEQSGDDLGSKCCRYIVIITLHKRSTLPEKLTFLSGIELVKSCLDSSGV